MDDAQRLDPLRYPVPCAGCSGYVAFDEPSGRSWLREPGTPRVYHSDCYERKLLVDAHELMQSVAVSSAAPAAIPAPDPFEPFEIPEASELSSHRTAAPRAGQWLVPQGAWGVSS